jgi:signal transduction histidine kinase
MPTEQDITDSERRHTDESLRAERDKADDVLAERLMHVDATADAVISRARARADQVLAKARAKVDRNIGTAAPSALLASERTQADAVLHDERANADERLQQERADKVVALENERQETDRDLYSERARSDASLATRDEFLSVVSHDLRTMVHHVVGFAQLVETTASQEQVISYAHRIQRSGARMDRLIGDLVDVVSISAGRLAVTCEVGDPIDVVTEALDTFQSQAAASGISLVAEIESRGVLAKFDSARLLQVFTNLLSNAIKFTPGPGRVVVRIERVGADLRFSVSDTGIGIPTDQLDAVFRRFLQVGENDRRGLGLGLYISKCIVRGHGGRIWVASNPGHNTTFFFTLPIYERPLSA